MTTRRRGGWRGQEFRSREARSQLRVHRVGNMSMGWWTLNTLGKDHGGKRDRKLLAEQKSGLIT